MSRKRYRKFHAGSAVGIRLMCALRKHSENPKIPKFEFGDLLCRVKVNFARFSIEFLYESASLLRLQFCTLAPSHPGGSSAASPSLVLSYLSMGAGLLIGAGSMTGKKATRPDQTSSMRHAVDATVPASANRSLSVSLFLTHSPFSSLFIFFSLFFSICFSFRKHVLLLSLMSLFTLFASYVAVARGRHLSQARGKLKSEWRKIGRASKRRYGSSTMSTRNRSAKSCVSSRGGMGSKLGKSGFRPLRRPSNENLQLHPSPKSAIVPNTDPEMGIHEIQLSEPPRPARSHPVLESASRRRRRRTCGHGRHAS